MTYFGVKLCKHLEMPLEVCGKDGLNDEVAETFELSLLQMTQPVIFWVGEEQMPRRSCMVTFQHRAIIV